jgi:hypothetical protein
MNNESPPEGWKELISQSFIKFRQATNLDVLPSFFPPAPKELISDAESTLKILFPSELNSLLLATNGVGEILHNRDEDIFTGYFIWPIERIKRENDDYRKLPIYKEINMPFDCLLFIGDSGFGDNFGYAVVGSTVKRNAIYMWNHEDDSRSWVAPSIRDFIEWWPSGKIKI